MILFSLYSKIIRIISQIYIPIFLRKTIFYIIGKILFKMEREDFNKIKDPLKAYSNINKFFTRDINLPSQGENKIISPCEGEIIECGYIANTVKAKSIQYELKKLVLDEDLTKEFKNGSFLNIYLAPKNYHKIHAPCSGKIETVKHIKGTSFPVNKFFRSRVENIYLKNERIVLKIKNAEDQILMVIIAAAGVNNIDLKDLKNIKKGEEIAKFNLGSTVIIISDKKIFSDIKLRGINVLEDLF